MPSLFNIRVRSAAGMILLGAIVTVTASGCAGKSNKWKFASWDVKRAVGLKSEKPDPVTPHRMVATWTDTTLSTMGQKTQRGFGGKLMFFKRDSEDPVRVEGNLVVYAFDETDRPDHETQPTRRYVFPMDQFVLHESDSTLGPAYSFWLPWDEMGGQQRHISLIAKFQPKEGAVVVGEQTRHFLPGSTLDLKEKPMLAKVVQTEHGEQVRLATYSGQATASVGAGPTPDLAPERKRPMSTATIPLPQRISEASSLAPSHGETTTFDRSNAATPLSQLSTMKGESVPAAATQASYLAPVAAAPVAPTPVAVVAPAPRVTTATERRALIDAAKGAAAPGSLRDSLLETLPARARQAGK